MNASYAAFDLNFMPVQNPTTISDFVKGGYQNTGNAFSCPNPANPDCLIGTEASDDPTPFFYERVDNYWHLIIGDPSLGFAQETYTPIIGLFHSNSGGREPIFFTLNGNLEEWSGNGWDPLELQSTPYGPDDSSFSGNGTGDPNKMIMRQTLGKGSFSSTGSSIETWTCDVGQFCQEFLKPLETFKPLITQDYDDGQLFMAFSLDMRNISYNDMSTAGAMTNIISITSPPLPLTDPNGPMPNSFYFDMSTDSQRSVVTGGRYIYTSGTGWYNDGDGDVFRAYGEGTYQYDDGGVNSFHTEIDWGSYFDPSQNEPGIYPGNQSRCASMALAACSNPPSGF